MKTSLMFKSVLMAGLMAMVMGTTAEAKVKTLVTVLPQSDVVSRIGGDLVDVVVMIPQGADPHEYSPKPSQVKDATDAQLWFTVGMPMEEAQKDKIMAVAKDLKVVPYAQGVELRKYETIYELEEDGDVDVHHHGDDDHDKDHHDHDDHDGDHHDHDDHDGDHHDHDDHDGDHDDHDSDHHDCNCPECAGEHHHHHDHSGFDTHTWLSPKAAVIEAANVRDALISVDPENKATYEANYAKFEQDVKALDAQITEKLASAKGKSFMTFHPAWGYFARDYGLTQIPIEVEGKEPGPKTLAKLVDFAKKEEVKAILVEPQFSDKGAKVIAQQLGIPTLTVDPLSADWAKGLLEAADAIAQGVGK